jgi:transcriptional regulator with XRE-family HTH domain
MEPFGVLFGRLVREKRGVESMSQDALAAATGLTKSRISYIETGKTPNPQTRTVDALCVALNISLDERQRCHAVERAHLPKKLLIKLMRTFGVEMPEATEGELVAFLSLKANELRELQARLEGIASAEGRIADLVSKANAAIGDGDFDIADHFLQEAEAVHLESSTIVAVKRQAQLRLERGNASLLSGDISLAADHFERSSHYFSGIDPVLEADHRLEYSLLLRYYGYRYKNSAALFAAKIALAKNLEIWSKETHTEKWCDTKIALSGVGYRLSEFDAADNSLSHLEYAKVQLEEARSACSEHLLPMQSASIAINLANVYSHPLLSKTTADRVANLSLALELQNTALRLLPQAKEPERWGVLQHNLACSYVAMSKVSAVDADAVVLLNKAIQHADLSFEVRDPVESLQYWIASSRTLADALLTLAERATSEDAAPHIERAHAVLRAAQGRISESDHPHQWAQLQEQLARDRK